ncbi:Sulfoxide reductase catalytic subunit YedY [uncultured archaeon]|nr:Sulfoxide reductase catalytic subunit YedY [uncultured archaeon]
MKGLLIAFGLLALLLSGCVQETQNLPSVEVRNYSGKDLSSINDFRENSINGPQYINISNYALGVSGLVDRPLNLTYAQVLALPKYSKVVTLDCVEGWSVTILWEGVKLSDLLDEAGVKNGANTVIFRAYDGYSTSIPLDYIRSNNILLAYRMNNVTIPPERGFPFMVVAEDKWGYKWAKWVTSIEVSDNSSFQGYWESYGYSNSGNSNESMFK